MYTVAGVQNEVEKAKSELKMAMKASTASKASVAATLALAHILFQQKRFSEAHRYFCQVKLGNAALIHRLEIIQATQQPAGQFQQGFMLHAFE